MNKHPKNLPPNHYLDKVEMSNAIRAYRQKCTECETAGLETPQIPEYIGQCLLDICTGFSMRPNFSGYSFREEMVSDAIVVCLKYVRSFDPDMVSKITGYLVSPLAYFTQCAYHAFINRITKEANEAKIKLELVKSMDLDTFSVNPGDDGEFQMDLNEFMKSIEKVTVKVKDTPIKEKKQRAKPISPLEVFL